MKNQDKHPARRNNTTNEQPSGIEVVAETLLRILGRLGKWGLIVFLAIVLAIVVLGYIFMNKITDNSASVDVDQSISLTPTQITAMKQIGQWEFLSISDEELIDTTKAGFFTDSELIRIYYGTLRLGFDLKDAADDWIKNDKDTILVTLPPIGLLDENFIDEAKTKSFYESGSWSDEDRETMYRRAKQRMKARGLNATNMNSAEQNASRQFYEMIRALGFEHVKVRFATDKVEKLKE